MATFVERISIIIDSKVDGAVTGFKKLKTDIAGADGAIGKFKAGMSGVGDTMRANKGAIAAAGVGAVVMAAQIHEAGVALEQMDSKAEAVFEGSLGQVRTWASENAKAMGVTESAAINAAAGIADLLKPMGFTAEAAADQALKMMDLAGALSAWSAGKYDAAQVSEILSKAMLGEREQLKSLGISITEADVKARLLKNGQDELTGSALAQAKAMATQQLIFEKSTDAQKAWADGSMDGVKAANEQKASMAQLSETVTRALYPAISELVPMITEAAEAATPLITQVGKLNKALDGLSNASKIASLTNPLSAFPTVNDFAKRSSAVDTSSMSLDKFTETIRKHFPEVGTATHMLEEWAAANDGSGVSAAALEERIYGTNAAFFEARDAAGRGADGLSEWGDAAEETGTLAQQAADRVAALKDELQDIDDENAALDLADQFDSLEQAAQEAWDASASGAEDADKAQRDHQRELNRTKQRVAEYAAEVLKLPANRITKMLADIDNGSLAAVEAELDRLTKNRTVTITTKTAASGSGGGTGGLSGGTVGVGGKLVESFGRGDPAAGGNRFEVNVNVSASPGADGRAIAEALQRAFNDGGRWPWMA